MQNEDPIKILVVDDDATIRDVIKLFFEQKGYEVYLSEDGDKALKIIQETDLHCIFTDINMPGMNGIEFANQVRQIDNTLPVVIMTGTPSMESLIQSLRNGVGVADYLVKPINLEEMEFTVRRVLRGRKIFIENILLKEEISRHNHLEELNDKLMGRIRDLNILNRIMEDFSETDSTDMAYEKVVELGVEELLADQVFFHLYSPEDAALIQMASRVKKDMMQEPEENIWVDIPDKIKTYLLNAIEKNDTPCLIACPNAQMDDINSVHSCMVVPLKIRKKLFGIVTAFIFNEKHHFSEKDIYYLNFIAQKAASAIENVALYGNIVENLYATFIAFVTTLEARDPYTHKHSTRVAEYAMDLARHMGCTEEELDVIDMASRLHDIGKIGVPDHVLLKPGKLTQKEYEVIKIHSVLGAKIVGKLGLWDQETAIIRHHHERIDGKGYPDGLRGEEIPKLARIIAVADSYDAMASDRSYRHRMKKEKIIDNIARNTGTQFDPEVVDVFLKRVNSLSWKKIDSSS